MRLLLTSDWQTDRTNIDLCEKSLDELLTAADKYKPDAIVHAGDLKDPYDPVHMVIPKFWVRATRRIIEAGYRFIVLLGNHDRISQSHASKNWLDLIRVAGAEVVTQPKWKQVGNGGVAFLPYTGDKKQQIEWADKLMSMDTQNADVSVLVFHNEVYGATMGGLQSRGITPEQLQSDKYTICLGGHLHKHHRVDDTNVYFIGSPFCQDWGEANQKKGHVLWDSETAKLTHIRTSIPHWYDVEWLTKHPNVKPEAGAYIRSRVVVSTKKITAQLRAEEERIASIYGSGVRAFTIPKLEKLAVDEVALEGVADIEKVERYVTATLPENSRFTAKKAVSYIAWKLHDAGKTKTLAGRVYFESIRARNVLSFEDVKIDYRKQGLILLKGKNVDWPKRSNGGGKTNALSLLPIALIGETLKGQQNDAWANEHNDFAASVQLKLTDGRGRKVSVDRRRRPHTLTLVVNKVDVSSGLTGKRKQETQGLIEEYTGYDRMMLLNSVYIDQSIANGFVFSKQKMRMDLIGKLQNLERFDAGLQTISADIKANISASDVLSTQISEWDFQLSECESDLAETQAKVVTDWAKKLQAQDVALRRLTQVVASLNAVKDQYDRFQKDADELATDLQTADNQYSTLVNLLSMAERDLVTGSRLLAEGKCTRCGQSTKIAGYHKSKAAEKRCVEIKAKLESKLVEVTTLKNKWKQVDSKLDSYVTNCKEAKVELQNARESIATIKEAADDEAKRNASLVTKQKAFVSKIGKLTRFLSSGRAAVHQLDEDHEMLQYAKKAFMRSGMPLYLAAGLCPVLNKAAEEYAELFFQGRIQVRFEVRDGEFEVDVVNVAGSGTVAGQSVGEGAQAGVVAAFALREVSPVTNLLIMDEPGHGLDPEGARQFALGLLKLKDKFETIIVTTHNAQIDAVLSGEKVWTVIKKDRISRLVM